MTRSTPAAISGLAALLAAPALAQVPQAPAPAGPPASGVAQPFAAAKTTGPALTLEQAMLLAEEKGYQSRLATATSEAAEAKVSQARGGVGPRLDLDATKVWFDRDVNTLTGVLPQLPETVTTAGLQLSQPLIGLAPLLLQVRAASLQAENARNDEATTKRDARLQGAQAYLNAQKASQFVSLAEAALQVSQNQFRESQALLRAGRLAQADATRFELSLSDARQQLTQARITLEIATTALAETLGTPGQTYTLEGPAESRFERSKPSLPDLATALGTAETARTEAKNAANTVQVAEYYKLASDLDYLPSLNAFARYERDFEAKDTRYPPQTAPQPPPGSRLYKKEDIQDKLSYGLQLKWNVWDWGTRWNRSTEYATNVRRANIGKEAAESGVRLDVTSSLLQLRGAAEGLETSKTSVRLAEEVYRLTKVRFQNGQATSTDVITAERDQTRARGGLVNARADLDLAWLRYQKSVGTSPAVQTR